MAQQYMPFLDLHAHAEAPGVVVKPQKNMRGVTSWSEPREWQIRSR